MGRKFLYGLIYITIILLLSGLVMFLWNAILPQILHVALINYWHSLGLLLFCRLLFGGFHFGGIIRKIQGETSSDIIKDKLIGDDDNTRNAFKEEWRKRCEKRDLS